MQTGGSATARLFFASRCFSVGLSGQPGGRRKITHRFIGGSRSARWPQSRQGRKKCRESSTRWDGFSAVLMGLASGSIDSTISRPYPSAMNLERIRNRVSGGGFRPFALRTSDGREYPVRHVECVLVGPRSLAVLDREGEIVTLDPCISW